jgi:PAS domain S-box-containing protein
MLPLADSPCFEPSRFEPLLDSITDGVIALDLEGRLTWINVGAERLLGRARQDMLGLELWAALPELEAMALGRACRHALEEGAPTSVEAHLVDLGAWLEARVFPSREGLLLLLRDVTPRRQMEAEYTRLFELARAERDRAEQANHAKDEFLATISHELRTPLTAILGWARMLRSGILPPEKHARALETVERNARAQAQLVNDLLDISRIAAGKMYLAIQPVELASVVETALEVVCPAAIARGILLEQELDAGLGPLQGDPDRLLQVVGNLLNNAIKFTPPGGRVALRLRRAKDQAELRVTDTGQGIPSSFLPHVFERFRQLEGRTSRQHGGLGLGLAIVRHLVEMHGGTVEAHSEGPGRGACFIVRLPLDACP